MVELFILIIIWIIDLIKWMFRMVFKLTVLTISAILKIFSWILEIIINILDSSKTNRLKESSHKKQRSAQQMSKSNDWDEIDEYVMYDEMLYNEDE